MRMYPFPDTKRTRVLLALLMAALIYTCRDSMYTTAMLGFNKAYLLTGLLTAAAGIAFLIQNRRRVKQILKDPRMGVLIVVTAILLLPMLVKQDWQMMYMSMLLCLWMGIFFSFFWELKDAAKCFVVILTAIGIYSMAATYVLRLLPDRGIFHVPVFYNSTGYMFHHFGLSIVSDSYVRMRNYGIFREPSIYHCFVLLALYLNNYTVVWEKEKWLWIVNGLLSLTMLSTLATGGFVELAILAFMVFIHKKLYRNKIAWVLIGIMALVLGIFLAVVIAQQGELYWTLYGTFVSKFQPGADSSSDRVGSIVENLRFFFQYPLFGGRIAAVFETVPNNTSSTTLLLAILGAGGGLLHLAVWAALIWDKRYSVISNLTLMLVMFMALNTQNLIADLHFWMLPAMALCQRWLPMRKKET